MSDAASLHDEPSFSETTLEDLDLLAENIREEDRLEIFYATGMKPLEAIEMSYTNSYKCFSARVGGKLVCIFGVAPYEAGGAPWLLGTNEMSRMPKEVIRYSKVLKGRMQEIYPHLQNYVWSGNTTHIRWLKWLGFEFTGKTLVCRGEIFRHFESKERHVC